MNINYYNPYVRQELELYHHGIAGQKWGKRNGPPYPIAASAHSASEKKAGWRKSLSSGSKDYSKRNVRLAKKYDNKAARAQEKMLNAYGNSQKYGDTAKGKREWEKSKKYRSKYFDNEKMSKRFADAGSKKISRFTPEQKARAKKIAVTALKIAGAIAVTAAAGYVGYKGVKAAQYALVLNQMNKAEALRKTINAANIRKFNAPVDIKSVTYNKLGQKITRFVDGGWIKDPAINSGAVRQMKRAYRLGR